MTAPSLLCIENTVFPFRWRDDGGEKGSCVADGGGGRVEDCHRNGLQNLGPHLFTKKRIKKPARDTDSEKGGDDGSREVEGEAGEEEEEEEGRKKEKTTAAQRSA